MLTLISEEAAFLRKRLLDLCEVFSYLPAHEQNLAWQAVYQSHREQEHDGNIPAQVIQAKPAINDADE